MDAYKRSIPVSMTRHPGVHIMPALQHHDAAPSTKLSEMTSLDYLFQVKAMKTGPDLANGNSQTTISADILRNRAIHARTAEPHAATSASVRPKGHRVTFKDCCPSDPNAVHLSSENVSEENRPESKVDSGSAIIQESADAIVEECIKADLCTSVVVYGSSVVKDANKSNPEQVAPSRRSARGSAKESVHLFKRRWKTFCQVQKFSRPTSNDLLSCISIQSANRRTAMVGNDAAPGRTDPKHRTILFSAQSERSGMTGGVSSSCSIRSWPFSKSDTGVLFYRSKKHASPLHSHVVFNKKLSSSSSSGMADVRRLRLQPTREVEVTSLQTPCALSAVGGRSCNQFVIGKMPPSQVLQAHRVDAYLKGKPSSKTNKALLTAGRLDNSVTLMTCNGDKL